MSADTVTLKIEEKAKETARIILEDAQKEAEKKSDAVIADANIRKDKILENAEHQSGIAKKGIIQAANVKRKLDALKKETSLLEEVKLSAKKELLELSEKEILSLFVSHLKKSLLSGSYTLVPSEFHRAVLDKNIKEIEKQVGVTLTLSDKSADIENGFILESEIYDVDFSLDAIIDEVFEKNKKEIHTTLFNLS